MEPIKIRDEDMKFACNTLRFYAPEDLDKRMKREFDKRTDKIKTKNAKLNIRFKDKDRL